MSSCRATLSARMDTAELAELAADPGFRKVARALFVMARTKGWGHVTVRFQEGKIRQVDTLATERVDDPPMPVAARPAA